MMEVHTLQDPSPGEMSPRYVLSRKHARNDTGKYVIHVKQESFVTVPTDVRKKLFNILQDTLMLTGQTQEVV